MAIVLTLGRKVMSVICAYGPQSGRTDAEKVYFYDEVGSEWDLGSSSEIIVSLGNFNGHVGKCAEGFESVHGEDGVGKRNAEGRRLLEFCDERELWVVNTWFKKTDKSKITYSAGGCGTEIDFVLVGEKYRKYIRDVKVIPWKLQHWLVVVDLDKKVLKKVVRKEQIIRRKIWKLNENQTRVRFEKRVKELVSLDAPDLWKIFRDGVLKACDELCGKKKSRRYQGDMWWWNEEVKDTITRKKAAFKELCRFPSEQNKTQYKRIRNQTRKIVAKAMRMEANQELNNLYQNSNSVFYFLRRMKNEGKDVEGGRCLRGGDGRLGFIEEDRAKIWKEHMEKVMNEENEWDRMVEKVARNEIVEAIQSMKSGKATGTSEVSVEMIVASGKIGVKVMMELCQRVLDGIGMPDEWKTSVIVPIFKGKSDVMSCGSYRGVKLLEHAMKIVGRVLERRIRALVNLNEMQFGFMPGKGTVDAIFIVKRMQEKYQ